MKIINETLNLSKQDKDERIKIFIEKIIEINENFLVDEISR